MLKQLCTGELLLLTGSAMQMRQRGMGRSVMLCTYTQLRHCTH